MCPCDPVVLVSISSSLAELYFPSLIIISLSPLNIALRTTWLLSCSLDEVSNVGTLLQTSISSPRLTHPLETVCILLLDLVVALAKFLLVFIFSLEETPIRASFLSQQPSLRAFT